MIAKLRSFQARAAEENTTVLKLVHEYIALRHKATEEQMMLSISSTRLRSDMPVFKDSVTDLKFGKKDARPYLTPKLSKQDTFATAATAASSIGGPGKSTPINLGKLSSVKGSPSELQDRIRNLLAQKCKNIYQDRILAIRRKHKDEIKNAKCEKHNTDPEKESKPEAKLVIMKEPGLHKQNTLVKQQSIRRQESL